MNRNARLALVLTVALGAAGVASFGVYRVVAAMPVREVEVVSLETVVAARPIPVGTIVTKDHVKLVPWPARNPVPGSFTKIEDVLNRGAIVEVSENEPLTESRLAPLGSGGGLPPTITEGMRAISVRTNEVVGVAGFVVPGTRVDVVVVLGKNDIHRRADITGGREQRAGADGGDQVRPGEGKSRRQADPCDSGHAARDAGGRRAHLARRQRGTDHADAAQSARRRANDDQRRADGEPAGGAGAAGHGQEALKDGGS